MAIIYADPLGSNTSPYETWEKAATLIQTAVDLATAGDIVEIQNGIWAENVATRANGTLGNVITIKGKAEGLTHWKKVGIGVSTEALDMEHSYHTLENLLFDGNDVADSYGPLRIWIGADHCVFNDIELAGIGYLNIYESAGKESLIFNRCIFNGNFRPGDPTVNQILYTQSASGSSKLHFNYCKFVSGNGRLLQAIWARNGAELTFYNCLFQGFSGDVFYAYDNGNDYIARNCTFIGHDDSKSGGLGIFKQRSANSSTFDVDYCYLIPGVDNSESSQLWGTAGVTDGGHNITFENPLLSSPGHDGLILFAVDDSIDDTDKALMVNYAAVCDTYGVHMTWFINPAYMVNGDISNATAAMQALVAAGHEIACHGWSHTALTSTDGIKATGTGTTPTINIDRTADTITCNDVESGNQVISGFKAKNISAIIIEIDAFTGWSAVVASAPFEYSKGEALADTSGAQAASTEYTALLLLDTSCATGLFKVELADAKAWIESEIGSGYVCSTFGYGQGLYDDNALAAVKSAGFDLGRTTYTVDGDLAYLNIGKFNVRTSRGHIVEGGESEANLRQKFRCMTYSVLVGGYPFATYSHNEADFTPEQLGWMLDEVQTTDLDSKVLIGTYKEWFLLLDDPGVYDFSDDTYHMIFPRYAVPSSPLFQDLSPLKNAGVEVGLTTDYFGTAVPQGSAPDIGLYELSALERLLASQADIVTSILSSGGFQERLLASQADIVSIITDPVFERLMIFWSTAGIVSIITDPVFERAWTFTSPANIMSVISDPVWYSHVKGPAIKILNSFKSHKDSNILWDI